MKKSMVFSSFLFLLAACEAPAPMPMPALDAGAGSDAQTEASDAGQDAQTDAMADAVDSTADATTSADGSVPADTSPADTASSVTLADASVDAGDAASDAGLDASGTCCTTSPFTTIANAALPGSPMNLTGATTLCGHPVIKWNWTLVQPPGSGAAFLPTAQSADPTLAATVSGQYTLCLQVWNDQGQTCGPQCESFAVVPDAALHLELTWDTPADPDPFDSGPGAGADMDLHLGHELASSPDADCDGKPDPWFDQAHDCYWFDPQPKWGDPSSFQDDPVMDIDDSDGAGPEEITLPQPETATYSLGVHYWNDHGFGKSFAHIRVYTYGVIAFDLAGVEMKTGDMWYVGKVNWPNVLNGGTKPPLDVCYQSGDACLAQVDPTNPKAGMMWQSKGDWCMTHCYGAPPAIAAAAGPCP